MAIYNRKTKERKYIGDVISDRGTFRMDTSMDEVVIWNWDKMCTETIYLCGYDEYIERGYKMSEETKKAYYAYQEMWEAKRAMMHKREMERALKKGEMVKVVRGRKVPLNTIGEVFFIKEGISITTITIGIIDEDGNKHYTSARNLEKIDGGEFNKVWNDYSNEFLYVV